MNILLFGGFLGSGKTTILLQAAEYIVREKGQTAAIIENEIGEIGIDNTVISQFGYRVRGVFAGCICCQVTGDLLKTIDELYAEYHTDWIIIETSGVAVPEKVAEALNQYCKSFENLKIVAIADAFRWDELIVTLQPLMMSQLEGAELILLNKTDKIDGTSIPSIESAIRSINSGAQLICLSASEPIPTEVMDRIVTFAGR